MIIFAILFIILLILHNKKNIQFLTRDDLRSFVLSDRDGYIRSMNKKELSKRECKTNDEYKMLYINGIIEFEPEQKIRLEKYSRIATEFLRNIRSPYIDNYHIVNTPWNFARIRKTLEFGYPHTRGDVIFIPENNLDRPDEKIIRTLIHEKIHIYQRLHREKFIHSLLHNGFKILGKINDSDISSNPDIDNIVYRHPNGRVMMLTKNSKRLIDGLYEHPNELIAYSIAHIYYMRAKGKLN